LLSAKTTVPLVAVCVPAAALIAGCVDCANEADAVTRLDPLMPNVTLFELLKTSVPVDTDCVPALTPNGVSTGTDAVTTELLDIPNVTPFELLKTIVPLVAVCVPA
jgi:hypothetical protein